MRLALSVGQIRVGVLAGTAALGLLAAGLSSAPAFAAGVPTITRIRPTSGPVGTSVRIRGTNFVPGSTTVSFGGLAATVSCANATLCDAISPAGSGTVNVMLTTPSGSATAADTYTYTSSASAPTITGISPTSGGAGTQVTIAGTNFVPGATSATFDGIQVTASCGSSTSCSITAPSLQTAPANVTLLVTTSAGTSNAVAFSYAGAGSGVMLNQIEPSAGPAGTPVAFIGSGFLPGPATAVFGTMSVTASCSNTTYCTAVAPAQPYGATSVQVELLTGGATANAGTFTYTYSTGGCYPGYVLTPQGCIPVNGGGTSGMVISQIQPSAGPAGTSVTFFGAGFPPGPATAIFGAASATAYCSNSTYCTAVAPAQPYGAATVQIELQSNGFTSNAGTFSYTNAGAVTGTLLNITSFGTVQGTVGQPISFSAPVSTGSVPYDTVFSWNFGDGTTAAGQSVQHTYYAAGTYTVSLTAQSAAYGMTGSASGTAVIAATVPVVAVPTTTGPTAVLGATSGPLVGYQAGWNLVGGPTGTDFPEADNPLYTYQAGDAAYVTLPNTAGISGGQGYWAYFNSATSVALAASGSSLPFSLSAPAGQYVMVGNPSATQSVTVRGADVVYTFNPTTNSYTLAGTPATLAPGQAAWVFSYAGGTITVQ